MSDNDNGMTYSDAGVVSLETEEAFSTLLHWVNKSMEGHDEVRAEVGLYATVIEVAPNLGIAVTTDGVGTKLLVAEMMDKYDTVGIDCVAMNVNDLICVGAKPLAMLDYIAVENAQDPLLGEVGRGLYEGARLSDISIPAGEVAQLKEMIKGVREGKGFDLVGTAIGSVELDRMITGEGICDGDAVVGVSSSGLHSNGYTLARKVMVDKFGVDSHIEELGMTVGEALLEPTRIYVRPCLQVLREVPGVRALVHITGEGFRNLRRVRSETGFVLDGLPELPPIFRVIQKEGKVSNAEMANTFNLGVGMCVVVDASKAEEVQKIFHGHGMEAFLLGRARPDKDRAIEIPALSVTGRKERFYEV